MARTATKKKPSNIVKLPVSIPYCERQTRCINRAIRAFDDMGSFDERLQAIMYLVHRFLGYSWFKNMPKKSEK